MTENEFVPYVFPGDPLGGAYVAMEAEFLRRKKKNPKLTMKQFLKDFCTGVFGGSKAETRLNPSGLEGK